MKKTTILTTALLICLCTIACLSESSEKKSPDQEKALASYKKQKHRFELRDCHLYYNEKQILFYDSLAKYEKIFGKNYVAYGSNLYYRDAPVSLYVEWANLLDRQKGKPGADKDTTNIVNSINVWLSYPDDIDKTWGPMVDINKYFKQQKLLQGYIMIDSVLLDASSDIDDINQKLLKRTGYAKIQPFHGDYNSLKYRYYYPEANSCSPIEDKNLPTTTTISIWREHSKKIRWVSYGYSVNDRAPDAAVEQRLQDVDSALRIKTDHKFKTKKN